MNAGLDRALQKLRAGQPWGQELVGRWQEVVNRYAEEYVVKPTGELIPAAPLSGTGHEVMPEAEDRRVERRVT